MSSVALLGGGGHASDLLTVLEAIADASGEEPAVFVADDHWERPERFADRPIAQRIDSIETGAAKAPFLVAVGFPAGRRAVHRRAMAAGGTAAEAIVHPSADLGIDVSLPRGVVVMGQTWLSAGVGVGVHVHIGYGVTIGHDTQIGEFSAVMPGACVGGDVTIGNDVLIGTNATVLQGLSVGDGAVIGAGAVVTRSVGPGVTAVGVPASPRPR